MRNPLVHLQQRGPGQLEKNKVFSSSQGGGSRWKSPGAPTETRPFAVGQHRMHCHFRSLDRCTFHIFLFFSASSFVSQKRHIWTDYVNQQFFLMCFSFLHIIFFFYIWHLRWSQKNWVFPQTNKKVVIENEAITFDVLMPWCFLNEFAFAWSSGRVWMSSVRRQVVLKIIFHSA